MKNLSVISAFVLGASVLAAAPALAIQPAVGISEIKKVSFTNIPRTNDNQIFVIGSQHAKSKAKTTSKKRVLQRNTRTFGSRSIIRRGRY